MKTRRSARVAVMLAVVFGLSAVTLFGQSAGLRAGSGKKAEKNEANERKEREATRKYRASLTPAKIRKVQNGPTIVLHPIHKDLSQPLSELVKLEKKVSAEDGPLAEDLRETTIELPEKVRYKPGELVDSFLQTSTPQTSTVFAGRNFAGPGLGVPGLVISGAPPDTTLAVGPNHIVAWVNSQFMIFNKTGVPQLPVNGFLNGNTIWAGFGGLCQSTNRGDPIVQYDQFADRWIFSQFAFNTAGGVPVTSYLQCFAVTTGPDPAGPYYRYAYDFSAIGPNGVPEFNDYGKIGVWNDAYYAGYNAYQGSPAGGNTGATLCAYDKYTMIGGGLATTLCAPVAFYAGGASIFPADIDGPNLPTDTTRGGLFMRYSNTTSSLRFLRLKPNFGAGTATLTDGFGGGTGSFVDLPVGTTTVACNGTGGTCVAQPGTTTKLDTIGDRLMYRVAYRNRGGVDSIVATHSVDPDAAGPRSSAIRWYEIRNPLADPNDPAASNRPFLYQNGTYDPGGIGDRWMGSIAMDADGNILVGYSVANSTALQKPSIAFAGRQDGDPLNTLQAELVPFLGSGSQNSGLTRWGDYTTMQVDPLDDRTFWFIGQYLQLDGTFNWSTRIFSYSFTAPPASPPTIAISFDPVVVKPNANSRLTFTITNPGTLQTLTGVGFVDPLPGLDVSAPNTQTGVCGGGSIVTVAGVRNITLTNGTLAPGESCTFSVNVYATSPGVRTNTTGTVTSNEGGNGNNAAATLTSPSSPTISTSFNPTSISLNANTTLSFTVTNPNPEQMLTGVGFVDTFPVGLIVATPSGLTGTCGDGIITAAAGSNSVSLTNGTLPGGSVCTFSVSVTGGGSGTKTNSTGPITANESNNGNAATATVVVSGPPPPSISKEFYPFNILVNDSTKLTFKITNPTPAQILTGVGFTDDFPAGLVVATPNGITGSCGGGTITAVPGSTSVSLANATVVGASCTFSVDVTGTTVGTKNNITGVITSIENGIGNPTSSTLYVNARVPATISKSFSPSTINFNQTSKLTFSVSNFGSQSLTGVGFVDTLPAGMVVATPNGLTGNCGLNAPISATPASNVVSLGNASLSASCSFSVNVTGTPGFKINTTSPVTSNENGNGNAATATLNITDFSPPTIATAFDPTTISPNGVSQLSFTITNPNAVQALSNVGFIDSLPAGLVVASPSGLTGNCSGTTATAGFGVLSMSNATLAAGASCSFSVNVKATTGGTKVNTTSAVRSNEAGTGNTATASLSVNGPPPPTIATSFNPSTIVLNASSQLSFTLTNPSASALTGVGFNDTFPAGLVVATPNGLTGNCGAGTITATAGSRSVALTNGSLAGGATCTFSVNVTGTTGATLVNITGVVTSNESGNGDVATASLNVIFGPTISKAFVLSTSPYIAATVPLNGSTPLQFNISNFNQGFTLTGISFVDTLPDGLVVATPNGRTGNCGPTTAVSGSNTIAITGATYTTGSCSFTVYVTATTIGNKVNTFTATSNETGQGNTATASILVVGPPSISTSFGAASIQVNGSTSLTFNIANGNPGQALSGVGLTDTLPAGLVVATPSGLTGSCGNGTITATAGSGSVSLSNGTISPASNCTFSVNVKGTSLGTKVNTTGTVTSTEGGAGSASTATLNVTGGTATHFSIVAPPTANAGTAFPFTMTALDANNNVSGLYSGTVHFTATDGSAVLPANSALTNGVGTFNATLNTVGTQTITAFDTNTSATTGTSSSINVANPVALRRARGDFDGDGRTDISVFRPSEGNWYVNGSTAGVTSAHWGISTDTLVPGDYDGDGAADYAVFRPTSADGVADFYVLSSSTFTMNGYVFGLPGDIAVNGDYDGDGITDVAVYRPSAGYWFINNSQSQAVTSFQFGTAGDTPLVMDFNGDGKADLAVYRPADHKWYMTSTTGPSQNYTAVQFGIPTDILVPADYDGDNKDDIAVFRPSESTWYIFRSSDGGVTAVKFGTSGDIPVPGDYDSDHKDDIAVFRPSNGTWYQSRSAAGFAAAAFGLSTDKPVLAAYQPTGTGSKATTTPRSKR